MLFSISHNDQWIHELPKPAEWREVAKDR